MLTHAKICTYTLLFFGWLNFFEGTALAGIVDDTISHCDQIREKKDRDLPLPALFTTRFETSIRKALEMCENASLIKHSDAPEKQRKLCQAIVKEISINQPKTVYEWNLAHYRLVLLFEVLNNPDTLVKTDKKRHGKHIGTKNKDIILKGIQSKESTEEFLKSKDFTKGVSMQALQVASDYEYCPIAIFDNVTLESINRATVNHVFPIGVILEPTYYDATSGGPLAFFKHDLVHNSDNDFVPIAKLLQSDKQTISDAKLILIKRINPTKKELLDYGLPLDSQRSLTPKEIELQVSRRGTYTKFVKTFEDFKEKYENFQCSAKEIHLAYFFLRHESVDTDFDSECLKDPNKRMMPQSLEETNAFSKVSFLNSSLPKELRGDLKQFEAEYNHGVQSICKNPSYTLTSTLCVFGSDLDKVNKDKQDEIRKYLTNAEGCLCSAWKKFKG